MIASQAALAIVPIRATLRDDEVPGKQDRTGASRGLERVESSPIVKDKEGNMRLTTGPLK